jgi:hypothetical protein
MDTNSQDFTSVKRHEIALYGMIRLPAWAERFVSVRLAFLGAMSQRPTDAT